MSAQPEPATDWYHHAECRQMAVDLFFPDSPNEIPAAAARACERCDVHSECLDHAIRHEDEGVWAGTSPAQRSRIRRNAGIRLDLPQTHTRIRGRDWDNTEPDLTEDEQEDTPWP